MKEQPLQKWYLRKGQPKVHKGSHNQGNEEYHQVLKPTRTSYHDVVVKWLLLSAVPKHTRFEAHRGKAFDMMNDKLALACLHEEETLFQQRVSNHIPNP